MRSSPWSGTCRHWAVHQQGGPDRALQRPLTMEEGGVVLMDLLWSDPTTNDGVEGVQPSPRGPRPGHLWPRPRQGVLQGAGHSCSPLSADQIPEQQISELSTAMICRITRG